MIAIKEGITADVANRLSINGRTAAVPPVRNTAIYLANRDYEKKSVNSNFYDN